MKIIKDVFEIEITDDLNKLRFMANELVPWAYYEISVDKGKVVSFRQDNHSLSIGNIVNRARTIILKLDHANEDRDNPNIVDCPLFPNIDD